MFFDDILNVFILLDVCTLMLINEGVIDINAQMVEWW